jgi:hypothetical protein
MILSRSMQEPFKKQERRSIKQRASAGSRTQKKSHPEG